MAEHFDRVARAFSRKAGVYDDFGRDHPHLAALRARVREHVLASCPPGGRMLELNAGTGADAVFFARRGLRVHATDISPGMLAEIERKIQAGGLGGRLTVQECSFLDLEQAAYAPFDYVFSNMGGLNCTADLRPVAEGIRRVLAPGGRVTLVVMPPVCPWELAQALRGNLRVATRRLRAGGVVAQVEGVRFRTCYFTPREVGQAFGPAFRPVHLESLAVFTPTADNKGFATRWPGLYRRLRALDLRLAARPPFNRWGDFFLLTLVYLPDAAQPGT